MGQQLYDSCRFKLRKHDKCRNYLLKPEAEISEGTALIDKLKIFLGSIVIALSACTSSEQVASPSRTTSFENSKFISLDAEALCNFGIEEAFTDLSAAIEEKLKKEGVRPYEYYHDKNILVWRLESGNPDEYFIQANFEGLSIFSHKDSLKEEECWERATNVFFHIANSVLWQNDVKFYALYGGKDLMGGFLTSDEVEKIKSENPDDKAEWPYLPMCYANLPDNFDRFNLHKFRRKPGVYNKFQHCPSPVEKAAL